MAKRILIAIDDSENAIRAVKFVAKAFTSDSRITLFSVTQDISTLCQMQSPELSSYFLAERAAFCTLENKKKELIETALENAKKILTEAGFNEKQIYLKIQPKKVGIARDIIQEANSGYDVAVLGRRGLSGIKEFIVGSISQKVIYGVKDASVLLVN